jgi:transcriptional regulator with XRE-family HTH domain
MTQAELAKESGIKFTIAQFETGARLPSVENLKKLALALNVSTDSLLDMPNYTRYLDSLSKEQIETIDCLVRHWITRTEPAVCKPLQNEGIRYE